MTPLDLEGLAARCESAAGPVQSLARGIVFAICGDDRDMLGCVDRGSLDPTRSTDDAMSILPKGPGGWPQVQYLSPNPNASDRSATHRVTIWLPMGTVRGRSKASFALALTAACLRARALQTEQS